MAGGREVRREIGRLLGRLTLRMQYRQYLTKDKWKICASAPLHSSPYWQDYFFLVNRIETPKRTQTATTKKSTKRKQSSGLVEFLVFHFACPTAKKGLNHNLITLSLSSLENCRNPSEHTFQHLNFNKRGILIILL